MSEYCNLIGKKFGKLTVVGLLDEHPGNGKHIILKCICDCGKETTVRKTNLLHGKKLSCGCLSREKTIERNKKHGYFGTRLYRIWNGILERTKYKVNHSAERYWKRGISICKEWEDFIVFKDWALKNGYKDSLTIDRIDNDGNYCPENCRWATRKQQSRNTSRNVFIEYKGEKVCLSELAEICGISKNALRKRFLRGYSIKEAVYPGRYKTRWKNHIG